MEKQKTRIVRVFDLDGTLTNTIGHNYVTTCQANAHFKLALPLFDHFRNTYDQRDGFKRHLNGLGVPEPLHQEYGKKWNELYIRMIRENPPLAIPGAKQALESMRKKGEDLILLTKASIDYVDIQLKIQWVNRIFTDVKYVDPGKSKATYLSAIKSEKNGCQVIYFGDTISDGFECRESAVPFGAMTHSYSFNSRKLLREFMEKEYRNSLAVAGVSDFNSAPKLFFNGGKR